MVMFFVVAAMATRHPRNFSFTSPVCLNFLSLLPSVQTILFVGAADEGDEGDEKEEGDEGDERNEGDHESLLLSLGLFFFGLL